MPGINGDQCVQSEVLEGLATAVNHRRWFVELAVPFLGDDPIEIGSDFLINGTDVDGFDSAWLANGTQIHPVQAVTLPTLA